MKCLIIMPFARQFDEVHDIIKLSVADALYGHNVYTMRLDESRIAGKITSQLVDALHSADFYIADITGLNPNVMWEAGFAAAIGRPAIFISQSVDPLPFDVKDERVVRYNRRNLEDTLYHPLKEAIRQTLNAYTPIRRRIAVTGTGNIYPQRALALLSNLLDPYLGRQFSWRCGANGTTDEVVIELLLRRGEIVTPVIDNIYRITAHARELIRAHSLEVIDAEDERIQAGWAVSAPNINITDNTPTEERAAQPDSAMIDYFLRYSDLLILLGLPAAGRTGKLVQGAGIRQRPYLLALP